MDPLIVWIQVLDKKEIEFSNPVVEWIKKEFPGSVFLDFDNYSENYLIDKAIELASGTDKIILMIRADEGKDRGQATRFLTRISRFTGKPILTFYNGNDDLIDKMLKVTGKENYFRNIGENDMKIKIREFMSGS